MSRYAAAHTKPQGPGDARPTALQIVKDEELEGKLKGKVIVVTGTSSGIGIETARALAATGATLYLTARDLKKAQDALVGILEEGRVELVQLDNASFDSVRAAASTILSKSNDQVNILVNNAGIMAIPDLQFTKDKHELQFGTNHLSHFLLFQLLKPALLASSTPGFHSRVVNVSSNAHSQGGINESDNYNYEKGGYHPWGAYAQSKTANIYMANEIDRRYGSKGLHATSVHPGIIGTGLTVHVPPEAFAEFVKNPDIANSIKSVEQGAATTVWAAIAKEWENKGGKYLADVGVPGEKKNPVPSDPGYVAHAYDPEKEERLCKDSLKLVDIQDDE